MHWFIAQHIKDNVAILSENESHHATKVLRLSLGNRVTVIDGMGKGWEATIEGKDGRLLVCLLEKPLPVQSAPKLTLAISPTKNMDRTEWFVEKATEIGVGHLVFFLSKNSERKKLRMDRIEKIAVAAAKQSQRLHIPKITGLIQFSDVWELDGHDKRFIAWCGTQKRPSVLLETALQGAKNPLICVGPEGDFTENEISMAKDADCIPVSLGTARLRTETAGVFCCVINRVACTP
ncbi:MAG: 16S rRNA (uracil(1498)-N(3))-methyltransferase [Cryomorphaceae bacterium]|nr:16S rRNA (uracil(1498)-N(3))-methyltransferase [Cryomorphaceae bacterium]